MRFKSLTLLMIVLFHIYLLGQGNPNPSVAVDNFIQGEMTSEHFPGVSIVIVKNGEIVWLESNGYADVGNNISLKTLLHQEKLKHTNF